MENKIKVFENRQVRTLWNAEEEEWYFSVIDVVAVLTNSTNPRKYWSVLKTRLKAEGSELATNCSQLKMQSADGKYYKIRNCFSTAIPRGRRCVSFSRTRHFGKVGITRMCFRFVR